MDSDSDIRNKLKIRFNEEFSKLVASKGVNSGFMNSEQYKDTIECVKEAKVTTSKTPKQYRRIKRFDVFCVGKVERLITPVSPDHEDFRYYATNEEIFDIIHETHLSIGHGGRQRMVQKINKVYKNITQEIISIYLSLCVPCKMKLKNARKSVVIKPVTHSEMNNHIYSRCQVEFIDMRCFPDEPYKFILVYQDYLTRFVQLRPLQFKSVIETAKVMLDIFCIFGVPMILDMNENENEFSNCLIEELAVLWPGPKIIRAKPRDGHLQENAEKCNNDIEKILTNWMQENNTQNWSEGLKFVQLTKNRLYHPGIKRSPYKAMFGMDFRMGLFNCSLPKELIEDISTEEELLYVAKEINIEQSN